MLAVLGLVAAGCGGGSTKSSAPPAPPSPPTPKAAVCPTVAAPRKRAESRKAPTSTLDAAKTWTATVETSCGSFTIRLDAGDSPHTTASVVSLARSGFYDGPALHPVVPGLGVPGGGPTPAGGAGPRYSGS